MMRQSLAAVAILLAASPAVAAPEGNLDIYYVPSAKVDISVPGFGSVDDDGDGFGVKGQAPLAERAVFRGEYQSVGYDGGGDIDQMRIGVGLMGERGGGLIAEYVKFEDGIEADGFGVHLRAGNRNFYASAGYLLLDEDENVTGLELAVGLAFMGSGNAGAFVDLRHTMLEGEDSNVEVDLTDIRVGLRIVL